MIMRFTDHAANERTYLAWVRTALAVMAFGGILGRSGIITPTGAGKTGPGVAAGLMANAGPAGIILGITMLFWAYGRFRRTQAAILCEGRQGPAKSRLELLLTLSLAMMGTVFLGALKGTGPA